MKPSVEALVELINLKFSHLSDEHLPWDSWALKWLEHNRTKPDLEYTKLIWTTTKGYADALTKLALDDPQNNFYVSRLSRSLLRESISNLAVMILVSPEQDFTSEIATFLKENNAQIAGSSTIG